MKLCFHTGVFNDFTHVLAEKEETKNDLLDSGLIDYWLETNLRSADNDGKNSAEERTTFLAFL